MKLQRYEKELLGLKDRVKLLEELIEKEKGNGNDRYPKVGEAYYFVDAGHLGKIAEVYTKDWKGSEIDLYYWNFCHGSTDENEVKWTIEHIKLVNEIKKYTKDFEEDAENWYFYKERSLGTHTLETWCVSADEESNEYGYFNSQEEIDKAIEQLGEEYIFKFLFKPRDGNYKAIMDWLADQEEE